MPRDEVLRALAEVSPIPLLISRQSDGEILYCNEKECVDEGTADSTMVTQRDKQQGFVYRRIKHFSGYQVSTGRDDEGTPPDSTTYQP